MFVRPLDSEDTRALVRCLAAMGASVEPEPGGLAMSGPLGVAADREVELDAGESGTAARFLTALCAVTRGRFLLTGAARLRERPMTALVTALSLRWCADFLPGRSRPATGDRRRNLVFASRDRRCFAVESVRLRASPGGSGVRGRARRSNRGSRGFLSVCLDDSGIAESVRTHRRDRRRWGARGPTRSRPGRSI